jgi:hypothetical protein
MDVVRRVWRELQEWADEESRARVKRKNQQVGRQRSPCRHEPLSAENDALDCPPFIAL